MTFYVKHLQWNAVIMWRLFFVNGIFLHQRQRLDFCKHTKEKKLFRAIEMFKNLIFFCYQSVGCSVISDCSIILRHSHEICARWGGRHHLPDYYIWVAVSRLQRRQLWWPHQWLELKGQLVHAEAPVCFSQQGTCRWRAYPQGHPLLPHQCHRLVWQQDHI